MPLYYLDSTQNTCELREEDILPAIESGLLRDDTFVWREGMADWVPFENLKPEFMPDVSPPEDPAAGEDIGFHTGSPVWEILNREIFLVKKALDASADSANFDIFEPEMGALILECREVAHQKRRSFLSENSSFDIALHLPHGGIQVCRIAGESSRFFGRTKSRIRIFNERNLEIASVVPGHGKPDLVSLFATDDQRRLVSVGGSLKDWSFQITGAGFAPMTTSRDWQGEGRELLNEEGNFAIAFPSSMPQNDPVRQMTLITMLALGRMELK